MAKIRKARLSVTIPPRQREWLGRIADEQEISIADVVERLLDAAIAEGEGQKLGARA